MLTLPQLERHLFAAADVRDAKLFGEVQVRTRLRYRDTVDGDFDPYKYKDKVRALIDEHITVLDLSQKIAPVRITDIDFRAPRTASAQRSRCCATGSGSPNAEPAGWSASTDRPSVSTHHRSLTMRPGCVSSPGVLEASTAVGLATRRQSRPQGGLAGQRQADPTPVA